MIIQQSVFDKWQIEDESIQSLITSPPYYALRKYSIPDVVIGGDKECKHEFDLRTTFNKNHIQGGECQRPHNFEMQKNSIGETGFCIHCQAWKGQYGLEPTPQMYVEHTLLWAKETWRVLRNDGVFFLNLGDSYSGSNCGSNDYTSKNRCKPESYVEIYKGQKVGRTNYPNKCQLLIPHRVAIALVDAGWTLRNTIVWHKTNGMPESVTDRFSKKYEYIFMFTKSGKYYFDLDSIREPHKQVSLERIKKPWNGHREKMSAYQNMDISKMCHPLGKNPGDVWKYEEERTAEDNFFDMLGYFADETGRKPTEKDILWIANCTGYKIPLTDNGDLWSIHTQASSEKHYAMWPERLVERMIKCSTKTGDTVLDCFAGAASTLKVAKELGRKGIGIDLGYHEISKRRISKIQRKMFV